MLGSAFRSTAFRRNDALTKQRHIIISILASFEIPCSPLKDKNLFDQDNRRNRRESRRAFLPSLSSVEMQLHNPCEMHTRCIVSAYRIVKYQFRNVQMLHIILLSINND